MCVSCSCSEGQKEVKETVTQPTTGKFQCQNPECRNIFFGGGRCPRCGSTNVSMVLES